LDKCPKPSFTNNLSHLSQKKNRHKSKILLIVQKFEGIGVMLLSFLFFSPLCSIALLKTFYLIVFYFLFSFFILINEQQLNTLQSTSFDGQSKWRLRRWWRRWPWRRRRVFCLIAKGSEQSKHAQGEQSTIIIAVHGDLWMNKRICEGVNAVQQLLIF
jgi:hypothetical protein